MLKPGTIVKARAEFGMETYKGKYGEVVTFETHPHIKANSGHTLEYENGGKTWVYWPETERGATLWHEYDLVIVCE